eukprot:m.88837 g.88837  ORF g.88837 m.88837 type:complete len:1116 (+) comp12278_c0_seq2:2-3349(+)
MTSKNSKAPAISSVDDDDDDMKVTDTDKRKGTKVGHINTDEEQMVDSNNCNNCDSTAIANSNSVEIGVAIGESVVDEEGQNNYNLAEMQHELARRGVESNIQSGRSSATLKGSSSISPGTPTPTPLDLLGLSVTEEHSNKLKTFRSSIVAKKEKEKEMEGERNSGDMLSPNDLSPTKDAVALRNRHLTVTSPLIRAMSDSFVVDGESATNSAESSKEFGSALRTSSSGRPSSLGKKPQASSFRKKKIARSLRGSSMRKQRGTRTSIYVNTNKHRPPWLINFREISITKTIGHGGFSTVMKGMWRNETVAVKKLLNEECHDDKKMEARLLQEAELLHSLRHRNIIQLKAACVDPPNFCLVLEYAEFGSLSTQIKHTLEPKQLLEWTEQIAKGMHYLHDEAPRTLIHRDLKTANILVGANQQLKISDFGLARVHEHTQSMKVDLAGTYSYMSPEVIKRSVFSKSADVWSFGVVCWSMLTSKVPYEGMVGMAVAYGIGAGRLKLTIPDECPYPFKDILEGCWQQKPEDRLSFQNILQFLQQPQTRPFTNTSIRRFQDMQDVWKVQIQTGLDKMKQEKQELFSLEDNLNRLAEEQKKREKMLDRREKMLQQREKEIQEKLRKKEEEFKRLEMKLSKETSSKKTKKNKKTKSSRRKSSTSDGTKLFSGRRLLTRLLSDEDVERDGSHLVDQPATSTKKNKKKRKKKEGGEKGQKERDKQINKTNDTKRDERGRKGGKPNEKGKSKANEKDGVEEYKTTPNENEKEDLEQQSNSSNKPLSSSQRNKLKKKRGRFGRRSVLSSVSSLESVSKQTSLTNLEVDTINHKNEINVTECVQPLLNKQCEEGDEVDEGSLESVSEKKVSFSLRDGRNITSLLEQSTPVPVHAMRKRHKGHQRSKSDVPFTQDMLAEEQRNILETANDKEACVECSEKGRPCAQCSICRLLHPNKPTAMSPSPLSTTSTSNQTSPQKKKRTLFFFRKGSPVSDTKEKDKKNESRVSRVVRALSPLTPVAHQKSHGKKKPTFVDCDDDDDGSDDGSDDGNDKQEESKNAKVGEAFQEYQQNQQRLPEGSYVSSYENHDFDPLRATYTMRDLVENASSMVQNGRQQAKRKKTGRSRLGSV